jgi:hypothetical protein
VPGLRMPASPTTAPLFQPASAVHSVVQQMQLAVGLMETLHWKSCFMRWVSVWVSPVAKPWSTILGYGRWLASVRVGTQVLQHSMLNWRPITPDLRQ